jgi:hypothetical protein
MNVTERVSRSSWLLGSFVTQVTRIVIRFSLIVKRTCGIYANGSQITAPHDPDAWLSDFASKIAPDLALNEFSVPYFASAVDLRLKEVNSNWDSQP